MKIRFLHLVALAGLLAACAAPPPAATPPPPPATLAPTVTAGPSPTPLPTRPAYLPGELVAYIAQTGDTLPALARRFNTTAREIMAANPVIPQSVTTLPPGFPMQIPIYYRSFWGTPYQILPDSWFVNGPQAAEFDTAAFVAGQPGWLNGYVEYAAGQNRSGANIVDYVATNFSVSPMLLLGLLEYQTAALSDPDLSGLDALYPLGYVSYQHRGLYLQLVYAANVLNNGYYRWRAGDLIEMELSDRTTERPDPWQNAASVALHYYFRSLPVNQYRHAIGPQGIAAVFQALFGDVWAQDEPHLPGSLEQPYFSLPFPAGEVWAFTGGPHAGWGEGYPLAALDFAPPDTAENCVISSDWATAIAAGQVVRSGEGLVALDLDQDGDERTGWVVFYLHLAAVGKAPLGAVLQQGDPLGHPSCEGGTSTGAHVHIARKYNGEWLAADFALPFVMEGWVPAAGDAPYQGTLTRFSARVEACVCSDSFSWVTAGPLPETDESGN
ncbi:MAG: LysM peptidoglycan-binding domain-containing protein [Chloroflexi bacterium]|nr:LysM peptidoglycan-binding domain-containing protein [Chloroflexota bacterium]